MKKQDDKEDSNGYTPLLNESTLQDDEDELEQVLMQKAEKGTKNLSGITKKSLWDCWDILNDLLYLGLSSYQGINDVRKIEYSQLINLLLV